MIEGLHWLEGAAGALLAWVALHWLGAPLLKFMSDRRDAIESVQEFGSMNGSRASEERVRAAMDALGEASRRMLFYAQTGPVSVRLYCRIRGYRLANAGRMLLGLHNVIAGGHAPFEYQADAIRICLGADRLISADRRRDIMRMVDEALISNAEDEDSE